MNKTSGELTDAGFHICNEALQLFGGYGYLKDFPMDQMPPEMLTMFTDRMTGRIKEKKDAHNVTKPVRFDLIDAGTGKVMNTLTQ